METEPQKFIGGNVGRVAQYLLPRFLGLIECGWLTSAPELQMEQMGGMVEPLLGLASADTMLKAFRYVYVSVMVYGSDGNLSLAARRLGVDRSTLVRIMKRMRESGVDLLPAGTKSLHRTGAHA